MSEWFSENLENMPKTIWLSKMIIQLSIVHFPMSQRFVFTFWFRPGESQIPNVMHTREVKRRTSKNEVHTWSLRLHLAKSMGVFTWQSLQLIGKNNTNPSDDNIWALYLGSINFQTSPTWIHLCMTLDVFFDGSRWSGVPAPCGQRRQAWSRGVPSRSGMATARNLLESKSSVVFHFVNRYFQGWHDNRMTICFFLFDFIIFRIFFNFVFGKLQT